jgi:arylsulfatase A-like enzyme
LVYEKPVLSLDISATMIALAGAPHDPSRTLDGVNLMPYLTGEDGGAPHEAIYLRKFDQGTFALRRGDQKLVIPKQGADVELYDLAHDVGESRNLAKGQRTTVGELDRLRLEWNAQLVEPVFDGLITRTPAKTRNGNSVE